MLDLQALLDARGAEGLDLVERHINPSFARVLRILGIDARFVRGQGAYLWDDKGNRYIDCVGGFAVFNVGRNHPTVREVLKQAMDLDLPNLPKMGTARLSGLLAEQLIDIAPRGLDTVYFCNSGAEGVETAIKYARAATGRERMVYCKKAYHGLTFGALALNGGDEFREGFGRLLEPSTQVPFDDLDALEYEIAKGDVAAFIVEPIQGKGVAVPSEGYLKEAAAICERHGTLFVADEVQTGFGRTGRMWACEHFGVEPDILVSAKGLSGGYVPVAAVLCQRAIHKKVFSSLDRCLVHSSTFSQNDLAMAAGLASLHVLREEKLVAQADRVGKYLKSKLTSMVGKYEMLKEVRGKGLMIGVEFGPPSSMRLRMGWSLLHKMETSLFCQAILIPLFKDHHVFAQVAGHHMDVIKLIPPLVLSEADADAIAAAFDEVVMSCHRFPGPVWEVGKRLTENAIKGNG